MQINIAKQIVIIAGMPRTGSSYLYHVLQNHPDLFLPHRKELSFFCSNFHKGESWYKNFFDSIQNNQFGLDISPIYFLDPKSIQRIKQFNPSIKVILCIRQPSEWILSWYSQLLSHELNLPSFEIFIKTHSFKPSIGNKFNINLEHNYIPNTIQKYVDIFGDNLLIYQYEYFNSHPYITLKTIEKFLKLTNFFNDNNFENIVINAGNRKNIWLISYLLSRESTVRLLELFIPKNTLKKIRNNFDRNSTPKGIVDSNIYNQENITLAKDFFSEDDKFVKDFFSLQAVQLGNGKVIN